ncbi:MAG: dihydrofolate reductase family protein [Actinomycetota bacterium]|nr:dihydrofolate reductase family protein [Actinomycetota bacterium]
MATLIYTGITSLDGYLADADGNFDWAGPDEEVHLFVNDLERPVGTYLYGRRLYEVMRYWETAHTEPDQPDHIRDFTNIWQAADKVVYSRTLHAASTAGTRLERDFDPEAVRELLAAADRDVSIAGAELAAVAIRAGLVGEFRQFLVPVVVGGGTPFFPADVRIRLDLVEQRRFGNGVVYLRYAVRAWGELTRS